VRYVVSSYLDDDSASQVLGPEGRDDPDPQLLAPSVRVLSLKRFQSGHANDPRRGYGGQSPFRNSSVPSESTRQAQVGIGPPLQGSG
jgi:hypothetical protein